MNNPLRYVDPSGLTDITVTPTQAPPEILWRMDCEGVTASTITTENGDTYIIVSGNTPQEILDAVAKKGNEIRKYEGDKDLNIIIRSAPYMQRSDTLYRLIYNDAFSHDIPEKWAKYYLNNYNFILKDELNCEIWDMATNNIDKYPGLSWLGTIAVVTLPTAFIVPGASAVPWAWYLFAGNTVKTGLSIFNALQCDKDDPDIPYQIRKPNGK